MTRRFTVAALIALAATIPSFAQTPTPAAVQGGAKPPAQASGKPAAPATPPPAVGGVATPADYVIGADDQLEIVFWRDKDMTATMTVRPDGMISLPLLNEVKAAGLTPEELRLSVTAIAEKLMEQPTVSVNVKDIKSRKVFITGQVGKPGEYQLLAPMTVLQMIAVAGGPSEYAKKSEILVVRTDGGKSTSHQFDYEEISKGKKLQQNILLKPGDTIIVP